MWTLPFIYAAYCLLALVVLKAGRFFVGQRVKARKSAERGCLPPPTFKSRGLFGIKTLKDSIQATKEDRGVQFIHEAFEGLGTNVHTIRAQIFDYELLLTRDTANCMAMFGTQSNDFDIGPHRAKTFYDLLGLGVMTARGQAWKHHRALLRPQFARHQLQNVDLFEKHLQALVGRLTVNSDGWTSKVDLAPLFFALTLDVSTEFLVGQSVHSQSPELQARIQASAGSNAPNFATFGKNLDIAKGFLDRRSALAKYGWLMRSKDYQQARESVQGLVEYFVARELADTTAKPVDEEKLVESSMDDKFVLLRELVKETRDPLILRNELLNVLHAARDTTACLLGWTFYQLARHPQVFDKLRRTILEKFPNQKAITFEQLHQPSYLVQVIDETIRLCAVVPMNERTALNDTTLPTGGGPDGKSPIFVAKGTQILVPTWSMQHRQDIWGDDVDEFKPERWEGRKFGWDFIPFGGGVRKCMGQQFAKTEAMYVVTRILQKFDKLENMEAPGPVKFHHAIENRSGTGVQVRLHLATDSEKQG